MLACPVRLVPVVAAVLTLGACGESEPDGPAQPMTAAEFRQELVGMPLCAKPRSGPLAGQNVCTVHNTDGTAVLAGSGLIARGYWATDGDRICRRDAKDTPDLRRCVRYERLPGHRYRNSDDVEFCIGPCR